MSNRANRSVVDLLVELAEARWHTSRNQFSQLAMTQLDALINVAIAIWHAHALADWCDSKKRSHTSSAALIFIAHLTNWAIASNATTSAPTSSVFSYKTSYWGIVHKTPVLKWVKDGRLITIWHPQAMNHYRRQLICQSRVHLNLAKLLFKEKWKYQLLTLSPYEQQ